MPRFLKRFVCTFIYIQMYHSHSHAGCTRLTLSAGGKKSTYAHEGPHHFPNTAHRPCFISFHGKKSRQILFEQATYIFCTK